MALDKQTLESTIEDTGLLEDDVQFAIKYLEYYYVDPNLPQKLATKDNLAEYTKQFQEIFGLPVTGQLDGRTIKAMKFTPRCGCPDYPMRSTEGEPLESKWGTNSLTYFIDSYVGNLSHSDQDDLIALAFQQWADCADLNFERVNNQTAARLIVSTGRGRSQNFDGPSGTLAWAYLPSGNNYDGQLLMRFDLDETWIVDARDRGILFLNVACHEFGHFLGLDHSRLSNALMAPYYSAGITKPQQNDDVSRIAALYGAAPVPPPTPPVPPPTPPVPPPTPPVPPPPPGTTHKVEITGVDLSNIKIDGRPITDFVLI